MDHNNSPPKEENGNTTTESDIIFKKLDKLVAVSSPKAPGIKDFAIVKPISRGAFGKVFLGYKITNSDKLFAIKVMRKSDMINKNMVSQVITERNALALSRSPFCVQLFYSLQTSACIYLVMEYMVGGDLKSLLTVSGYFDELAAKFYCAEVTLALQYLHDHGIVHRDIKPDNMLVSASGHVKLTDFGLSKIDLSRDLELSDLVNCSPNLNARTPGQLLSLTSHLSFGSVEKKTQSINQSNTFMQAINRQTSPESDVGSGHCLSYQQHDDRNVSGVLPFQSAEDISMSFIHRSTDQTGESASAYFTCNSSSDNRSSSSESYKLNKKTGSTGNISSIQSKQNMFNECSNIKFTTDDKGKIQNLDDDFTTYSFNNSKQTEDSGISSRKSDFSGHINCELSAIEKVEISTISKNDSSLDFSKSSNNLNNCQHTQSPNQNIHKCFKRPNCFHGLKRKRTVTNRLEDGSIHDGSSSTGLTQEINILDIGSSTPKKRKSKTPLKSVLKTRAISDDEMPVNENLNLGNVMFSTPVSSQKTQRGGLLKLKSTRFNLPSSLNSKNKDDPVMSPINPGNVQVTPKNTQTPFRTPKSVRRADINNDRILGTPDYLAPELLLSHGHGRAVDWWALGVCLYEFMTGIPPFNDETPQKVFDNILSRNIEWPQDDEALSVEAVDAVEMFLTMNPDTRPTGKDVQKMKFFENIDWNKLESMEPPFIPKPDNPTDTGYFEARNVLQHLKLSSFDLED